MEILNSTLSPSKDKHTEETVVESKHCTMGLEHPHVHVAVLDYFHDQRELTG